MILKVSTSNGHVFVNTDNIETINKWHMNPMYTEIMMVSGQVIRTMESPANITKTIQEWEKP